MRNPEVEETQDGRKYLARWERDRLGRGGGSGAAQTGKLEELHSGGLCFFSGSMSLEYCLSIWGKSSSRFEESKYIKVITESRLKRLFLISTYFLNFRMHALLSMEICGDNHV